MNVQNTRILSPVIQNDSTKTTEAKAVKIKDKIGKNSETKVARGKKKKADEGGKKRKRTEIESPGQRTRQSAKKQQVQKKEKEQVNKRKRDEKAKKEEQVKKKMVKLKGKKKVENDDKDFVVEEQHDEEDDNKDFESKFKSLRERTIVLPLYDATQSLSPERKSKIREMGFASMLDFPFQKIPGKLPYFVLKNLNTEKMEVSLPSGSKIKITPKKIWEVLGIPMGKKKLESDSPRDYNDEFLTAFKKQFEGKNFIWDHIHTSKIGWDDRTVQNWYYGPNTVLMLIYLHYTKCDGMVTIPRKWPAIRNWTSKDATDREMFEMCQGKFGLVDVIKENEETENESKVEKRKLKEVS
ncbi:hypothetical protein Tco_0757371 [Tanacetum coccineum]